MYWVYRKRVLTRGRKIIQARLISPPSDQLVRRHSADGIESPTQDDPYGVVLNLFYQVNPDYPSPDNYVDSFGFSLYSRRLVELMDSFGVKFEAFPVTMVDREGNVQCHLEYFVFHSLEGVLEAMDEERSGWTGDYDVGIPRLILDETKFEHRPLFLCNHIYVPLMRDDVKEEIERQGITGFLFLAPERYRSGSYGFAPYFDD